MQYIDNPDRALVAELLRLDEYVDMIIPRGGAGLHRLCREQSTIPVITGGIGICHLFVDDSADLARAVDVDRERQGAAAQRLQRAGHGAGASRRRRRVPAADGGAPGRRAASSCAPTPDALAILQRDARRRARWSPAGPDDFDQEWLALILGVKVVDGLDEAIDHIQAHSTEHSDGILTNDWHNATRFVNEINSAAVFVNASTRFNDGGQFGLGAEVAVSTQKLHARGPMGLEELTTYKWICIGDWHVRP